MSDKIQVRRGTAAQLAAITLSAGEPGLTTDTKKMYVGDGTTNLPVAMATQDTWIAPTLLNSWVSSAGAYSLAGYYKDDFGIVHIRGLINAGVVTTGTSIFVLPAGYRPSGQLLFASATYNGTSVIFCTIEIKADGTVMTGSNVATQLLSISLPPFRAEQ